MTAPPFAANAPESRDSEHLQLLAIFHFVLGGLALCGIGFLYLHYHLMRGVFAHPEIWKAGPGAAAPPKEFFEQFFRVFIWFYFFGGVLCVAISALNVVSGLFLLRRNHRIFSLVVAGLDCVQFPLGTALGVCTILVLLRDSVRQSYEQ